MKEDYQKILKVNSTFSFELSPFNGQSYQKQKWPGTLTSCPSGYKTSSEKFLS